MYWGPESQTWLGPTKEKIMSVSGIDEITYVDDWRLCRQFFLDWGLSPRRRAAMTGWCLETPERLPVRLWPPLATSACRPPSRLAPTLREGSGRKAKLTRRSTKAALVHSYRAL